MSNIGPIVALLAAAAAIQDCGRDQGGENEDADGSADWVMDAKEMQEEMQEESLPGEDAVEELEGADLFAEDDGSADSAEIPEDACIRGSVMLPFDLEVSGSGRTRVGDVSILHDFGQVERPGAVPALAYEVTEWLEFDITLYHVLAPGIDGLSVLYLYCTTGSPAYLSTIWSESYDTPMGDESATGTCLATAADTEVDVEIIDLLALPSPGELVTGFSVSGPGVSLGDTGGSMTLGGRSFSAYPFEVVDCTTICTADPADGWWELHMVLEDASTADRCFGILYLVLADPTTAQFAYGFCLRSLSPLGLRTFTAVWSAPVDGGGGGYNTPDGPRHPQLGYVLRPRPPSR